jgi:hypothetical protein
VKPAAAGACREFEPGAKAGSALGVLLNDLLQRRLRQKIGAAGFGGLGQLVDWRLGLVDGIDPDSLTGRLQAMCPRLTRPECAMALALNSFLPWREQLAMLRLAGSTGFSELHFATRCPTGVRGTPPVVDMVAAGPEGVVGIAVRVFDYLAPRRSGMSAGYRSLQVVDGMTGWVQLLRDGAGFDHVDVVGLAKIAIGLSRIFQRRPVRLLYLFLEPHEPAGTVFAAHRAELARLGDLVVDGAVSFSAGSLHELWQDWCAEDTPAAVRAIAAELANRYGVVMPRGAPL